MSQTTVPPADHPGRRLLIKALVVGVVLGGMVLIPKAYDSYTQHQAAKASATAAEASASAHASAQASATNAVPDDTQVCELLDSTDLEERTGLQILYYTMGRFHKSPVPTLDCYIYFDQPNIHIADRLILYYTETFAPEISLVEDRKGLADDSTVQPISMNDLPGEAVSYMLLGNERITWRSPNGANLHIWFLSAESNYGADNPPGAHELLLHILYQVVPIIDEFAAGPPQPMTDYPPGPTATPSP